MSDDDDDELGDDPLEDAFELARFPIRLNLPDADEALFYDAKEAVRREYRDSVKWKRLRCRSVKLLSESETGKMHLHRIC